MGAYVVVYKKLQTAKDVFEREFKDEGLQRRSRLEGIGDAAFLWTPERENDRYVIRFSRGNVHRYDEFEIRGSRKEMR